MMKALFMALIVLQAGQVAAQQVYPRSRVCFSYAVDMTTYHVVENNGFAVAVGQLPSPAPVLLNVLEVSYFSYNNELMIGINGGLSLGQPNGPLRFTKAALDIELGISGGSIDLYGGLKGFLLINMRQRGISSFDFSTVNVAYTEGQIFGFAPIAGIRAYIGILTVYAEGSVNVLPDSGALTDWYNTGSIAPFQNVSLEPFSLKGGIGIDF